MAHLDVPSWVPDEKKAALEAVNAEFEPRFAALAAKLQPVAEEVAAEFDRVVGEVAK